nr:ROK family protein [Propionibacteriaceae bacterium]
GCLEALVSEPALRRRLHTAVGQDISLETAIARAKSGDETTGKIFNDAGHTLGLALSGVVNLLNPALLIVGGEGAHTLDLLLDPMRAALQTHCFDGLFADLTLLVEPWGDDAWARGAAGLMLDELFHPTLYRDPGDDVATLASVFTQTTPDDRRPSLSAAG